MTSPRLLAASESQRTEADARRMRLEKDRAEFNRRLAAERDARQRAAANGDDY